MNETYIINFNIFPKELKCLILSNADIEYSYISLRYVCSEWYYMLRLNIKLFKDIFRNLKDGPCLSLNNFNYIYLSPPIGIQLKQSVNVFHNLIL